MVTLWLSGSPGEVRIALFEGTVWQDAALWRPGAPDGWHDHHLVRITRTVPALGGAFAMMENGTEAFLTSRKPLPEGTLVEAHIIRAAQNGKGPRLKPVTASVLKTVEDREPRCLSCGPSPLEELAARAPEAPIRFIDAHCTAQVPDILRHRLERVPPGTGPDPDWDTLTHPSTPVGPLVAHISPTPALVSIDLDSGQNAGGTHLSDFKANCAAFPLLLQTIRLRNLSGTLLIDPAGVKSRKRPALLPFLQKAADESTDPLRVAVTGITPSGLLELTRPRRRPSIHDLMASAHGQGLAILRQILHENLRGTTLHAPAPIIHALKNDPGACDDLALARGLPLKLEIASSPPCWSVS